MHEYKRNEESVKMLSFNPFILCRCFIKIIDINLNIPWNIISVALCPNIPSQHKLIMQHSMLRSRRHFKVF